MEQIELERRVKAIADAHQVIQEAVGRFVVGNKDLVDLIMIGVLTGGHILVDGVPGTAKTTISKIIARLIGYQFNRVQGAVDVQPADIVGIRVYDTNLHEFVLQKGPIFANYVIIDEINRLTPKTQSAFIEAMAEHQATLDGNTYPIESPFFVIATQNKGEFEGTFHLIEAQRDRFNFSMTLHHLEREQEIEILHRDRAGSLDWDDYEQQITPVLSIDQIQDMNRVIKEIYMDDALINYISDIVIASRNHDDIRLGTSTRGSLALLRGSGAYAALMGRTFVIPDDVKRMASPVLGHRLILEPEAELGRISVDDVVLDILKTVEVP